MTKRIKIIRPNIGHQRDKKNVVEVETKTSHNQYLMSLFDDYNMNSYEGLWSYIKTRNGSVNELC